MGGPVDKGSLKCEPEQLTTSEFMEEIVELDSAVIVEAVRRRTVALLHGAGSLGEWQRLVEDGLTGNDLGINPQRVVFDPVSRWGIIWRAKRRRQRHDIEAQICRLIDESESTDELTIVAHSYGSFLLIWWLKTPRGPNWLRFRRGASRGTKFRRIILVGSLVKRKWLANALKRADQFINIIALRDSAVCWAQALRPDKYEATGLFGFRQTMENLKEIRVEGDHSASVDADRFASVILPLLIGGEANSDPQSGGFDHNCVFRRRLLAVVILVAILSGVAALTFALAK